MAGVTTDIQGITEIIAYIKAAPYPMSARNMARKFSMRRAQLTRMLYVAKIDDPALTTFALKPQNVRHKKPVWHIRVPEQVEHA